MNQSGKKKNKAALHFFGALFIASGLLLLWGAGLLLLTFDLNMGSVNLQEVEDDARTDLLFSLLYVVPVGILSYVRFQHKKKNSARGFAVIPAVLFLIMFSTYLYHVLPYQKFDADVWKSERIKPFGMARAIYKEQTFRGITLDAAASELGIDESYADKAENYSGHIEFTTQRAWRLVFQIESDTISHISMKKGKGMFENGLKINMQPIKFN